jgi:Protein of unknown function (DUF1761)
MVTRLLAATVAGGIAFLVLGFLIYGLLLENSVMKPNTNTYPGLMNEVPVWVPLILANLVSALLLAYIFEKWAGIRTFAGGLQAGAIVWFLIALSFQLMFLAFMNLHKNYIPVVADIIGSTVMGAIGGGVVALVLGMMNKPAASE